VEQILFLPSIKPIFYFTAIVFLLYLYILFFRFVGRNILYLLKVNKRCREYKRQRKKNPELKQPIRFVKSEYKEDVLSHPFWMQSKEHRLYWSLFLIGNLFFWHYFRDKWVINGGYQHKEAREYYALGHLLLSYEMGLLKVIGDPASMVMLPIDAMQKQMIKEAKALLPENDGEYDIFRFHLLLYPYASRQYHPNVSKSLEIATLTYDILDGLSNKTIADPKVGEYDRYLFHTMSAHYYALAHLFRYRKIATLDSVNEVLFKDRTEYERLKRIVSWLINAHENWQRYPEITTFMQNNPKMPVIHYAMISLFLYEMAEYEIMNLEFRCDSETVALATEYFHYFKEHYQHLYLREEDKFFSEYENLAIFRSTTMDVFAHYLCGYSRLSEIPGYVYLQPEMVERTKNAGFKENFPFTERYLELDQIINHGKEIYEGRRELVPCDGVRCHSKEALMNIIKTEYEKGRYQ